MYYSLERARQEIGRSLRELRTSAGLTGAQLAAPLGWSQPKVSRLETGRQPPTGADVHAWASACEQAGAAEEIAEDERLVIIIPRNTLISAKADIPDA